MGRANSMTSLAKQILKSKRKKNCDDLGLPIEDGRGEEVLQRPQYLVARALLLEKKNPRYDEQTTIRLHLRQNEIYQHNRWIEENSANFHMLTGVAYAVPRRIQVLFWAELHRRLPQLDMSKYKICDGLWWDKENGEILDENRED